MLNTGPLAQARNRYRSGKYWCLTWPGHPHAYANGKVREHVHVAASALGRPLPKRAVVHHVNGDTLNNDRANLVVCDDVQYHNLLHRRQRALDECGDANAHRCTTCGLYDRQDEIVLGLRKRNDTKSQRTHHRAEHVSCMKARKAKETERIRAGLVAHRGPNVRGITRASGPRNVWTTPEERTAIGKKGGFARAVAMAARRSFDVAI